MQITVELPDDIAGHPQAGRQALEALVIEGYRSGKLTHHESSQLLGLTRLEFDDFLQDRGVYEHAYSAEDVTRDLIDLAKFQAQKKD